jgi:hypothetical protein
MAVNTSIPQAPSDTTTELNAGSGGDIMDESLVLQSDGTTEAKRPRVVPGFDDGSLQSYKRRGTVVEASVIDEESRHLLRRIHYEARKQTALLRMLLAHAGRTVGDDEIAAMAASEEEP